jgi:hypothetical protein
MRCPPIRSRGSGIRLSSRPVSGHLGSSSRRVRRSAVCCPLVRCPAVCCPPVRCPAVWCPAVWCRPLSVRTRPSPPMLRRWRWGLRSSWSGDPDHRNRWAPVAAGSSMVRSMVERPGRGRRWRGRGGHWEVGAGPGRRVGCGPRRPRLPAERPGRPGRRPERPSRAAARWARVQAAAPGGCTPRLAAVLGWARPRWVVVAEPDARVGGPGGPLEVPAGMACGPSAAQAGSERARLAAGSALTCDDGWWACQDLNLGPHPYQQSAGNRCADGCFRRSHSPVGAEVKCSNDLQLSALPTRQESH